MKGTYSNIDSLSLEYFLFEKITNFSIKTVNRQLNNEELNTFYVKILTIFYCNTKIMSNKKNSTIK